MKGFLFAIFFAVAAAGGAYRQDKNNYYNDGKQMNYMLDYKKDDKDYGMDYKKDDRHYGMDYKKDDKDYGMDYKTHDKVYGMDNKKDYGMDYNQNYEKAYSAPDYDTTPSPYNYEYAVYDAATYNDFQKQEHSDGYGNVKGSYDTLLPDGRTQIVTYTADKYGYNADVKYTGEAKYADNYAPPPYNKGSSYSSPMPSYMAPKSSNYQTTSYMGKYQPSSSYKMPSDKYVPQKY